jgi:hypothetical protein
MVRNLISRSSSSPRIILSFREVYACSSGVSRTGRRFAWLSDWLKRSDGEMIELETVYIELLLRNRVPLIRSWESRI